MQLSYAFIFYNTGPLF